MFEMVKISHPKMFFFFWILSSAHADYWSHMMNYFAKHGGDGTDIRSHCGRNRYSGNYFQPRRLEKRIIGGTKSRVAEWPWLVSLQLRPISNVQKRIPAELEELNLREDASLEEVAAIMAQLQLRLKEISPEAYADYEAERMYGKNDDDDFDEYDPLEGHTCGGTLISPQWILTARHCFEKSLNPYLSESPDRWVALLGEHHLLDMEHHQNEHDVAEIVLYPVDSLEEKPGFGKPLLNDIALIKLKEPAVLNEHVQIACLPYPHEVFHAGQSCAVSGWGLTKENGSISHIPQHIHIPLIGHEQCVARFEPLVEAFPSIRIGPATLCAGGSGGKDACQFDSGGPLMCRSKQDHQWIVTGIVSSGVSCASSYPGIYARVSYFIDWIREVTSKV